VCIPARGWSTLKAGIILGHLKYEVNEGTILRSAEAFGISNIFVIGGISKNGAEGADRHLLYHRFHEISDLIVFIKRNGFNIVVIEGINGAIPIEDAKYPTNPVFITGHENNGIPKEIMQAAKLTVKIIQAPAYVRCLNTAVAMGIVLNDFHTKLRRRERQDVHL
jgi:tRNA G18 (ribose-2'-O)-methylase SpoU